MLMAFILSSEENLDWLHFQLRCFLVLIALEYAEQAFMHRTPCRPGVEPCASRVVQARALIIDETFWAIRIAHRWRQRRRTLRVDEVPQLRQTIRRVPRQG